MKIKIVFWLSVCLVSCTGVKHNPLEQKQVGQVRANGINIAYESFGPARPSF